MSGTTMNMDLRPGEAIVWQWAQLTPFKHHGAEWDQAHLPLHGLQRSMGVSPGLLQGDLAKGRRAYTTLPPAPMAWSAEGGKRAPLSGPCAALTSWSGAASKRGRGGQILDVPWTAKTWQSVITNLDKYFPAVGPAHYEYQLKCQLEGAARLRRLAIINDLQMAPIALPEMAVGENAFTYCDQSARGLARCGLPTVGRALHFHPAHRTPSPALSA